MNESELNLEKYTSTRILKVMKGFKIKYGRVIDDADHLAGPRMEITISHKVDQDIELLNILYDKIVEWLK